jgi:hypothetical protein
MVICFYRGPQTKGIALNFRPIESVEMRVGTLDGTLGARLLFALFVAIVAIGSRQWYRTSGGINWSGKQETLLVAERLKIGKKS